MAVRTYNGTAAVAEGGFKAATPGREGGISEDTIPHGYVEMTFVKGTATGRGRNDRFIMEDMKNGTMKLTEGRIGITVGRYKPRVSYRLLSDWDMVYRSRVSRGYLATNKMDRVEVRKGKSVDVPAYAPVEDPRVRNFIEELDGYQKKAFDDSKKSYQMSTGDAWSCTEKLFWDEVGKRYFEQTEQPKF